MESRNIVLTHLQRKPAQVVSIPHSIQKIGHRNTNADLGISVGLSSNTVWEEMEKNSVLVEVYFQFLLDHLPRMTS